MKKTLVQILILASLCGCASRGEYRHSNATDVNLTHNNYRMIHAGATGTSQGFYLLGFIPFVSPSYAKAKSRIYESAKESLTGRSIALANQTEDRSTLYLILFSLPKVTITADIIEFKDEK